jgi:hypothetical protein
LSEKSATHPQQICEIADMERYTSQNNFLELKDLAISAFLYCSKQVSLGGKRRLPDGTVVFLWFPKDKAEELVNKYWSLQADPQQPKLLFSAWRDLKDMIFGG